MAVVLTWWLIVTGFAIVTANRLNVAGDDAYTWMDPAKIAPASWNPLELIIQWDATWFQGIVNDGYQYHGPDQLANIAFFPIFPLATRAVSWPLYDNTVLAGWAVSLIALIGAGYFLRKLVLEFHPKAVADETLLLLLTFPAATFFWAPYTETTLLFFAIASMYYARRGEFWKAGLLGFVAALSRPPGMLIVIPLVIEYCLRYWNRPLFRRELFALALPPLGLASYFAFLWASFGDPMAYFKVQSAWGRGFVLNAEHFWTGSPAAAANLGMDITYLVIGVALSILVLWRVRLSYGVYCLAAIFLPVMTGTLMSMNRYVGVLFPIYIAISQLFPKPVKQAWLFASILMLGLTLTLYVHGHWAG